MINIYLNQMAMIGDMDVKHNIVLTILSSGSILHETFFFFFSGSRKAYVCNDFIRFDFCEVECHQKLSY